MATQAQLSGQVSVKSYGGSLELRLHGWGSTGKGDRLEHLSAKDARLLAYQLLLEAEKIDGG